MKASELANQAIREYNEGPFNPSPKLYISVRLWREITEEFIHEPYVKVSGGVTVRSYQGLPVRRILEDGECFVK